VGTSTGQQYQPRRRTLPQPPRNVPEGKFGTRQTKVEFRSSSRENYGLGRSDAKMTQASQTRHTHAEIPQKCRADTYRGDHVPAGPSGPPTSHNYGQATALYDQTNGNDANDPEHPARYKATLSAKPPWNGMDTSSVPGSGIRPCVVQGARVTVTADKQKDFLGSLRSAEVSGLAPTESPAKQKSRKKSDGRVFDRLTNPKNFGVVHKNRHDATKRAQKEDDTLNKMIAGQAMITRTPHDPKRVPAPRPACVNAELYSRLNRREHKTPAVRETDYEKARKSRRDKWGADPDVVFAWQSGDAQNTKNYPASHQLPTQNFKATAFVAADPPLEPTRFMAPN